MERRRSCRSMNRTLVAQIIQLYFPAEKFEKIIKKQSFFYAEMIFQFIF
jgi:hypothetical protein